MRLVCLGQMKAGANWLYLVVEDKHVYDLVAVTSPKVSKGETILILSKKTLCHQLRICIT